MSEHAIFVKCAWRLIPLVMLLYLVNYIDRFNVGFAALTMNRDLGFSPTVFGFAGGSLLFGYMIFQIPANVVMQRLGARRWIFAIMAAWGLLSAACALVQGPISFYVLRFLVGVAEAGFVPGILFYLTLWFPKQYRMRFAATFSSSAALSGVVGGPLASLILTTMDKTAGLHGWQWLFLLEGAPAFLLAFLVLRLLPDGPEDAAWLSTSEKAVVAARLKAEDFAGERHLGKALRDPRLLALAAAALAHGAALYGTALWLPQIVQAMGFSNLATGFVVVVPYVASAAAMIAWGHSSDRRNERIWHLALPWLLCALGLITASVSGNYLLQLLGLTLAVMGIYSAICPLLTLPASFLRGTAAAGGIGFVNSFISLGGVIGSPMVGILKEQTGGYEASMLAIAAGTTVSALLALGIGRAIVGRRAGAVPA